MAPERCSRMTGITCLHAMIVPRRLIAQMRSKASSVISSSGLSPPAMLTPTLLCRMSIRPPARLGGGDRRGKSVFLGDVGSEGHALAALFRGHRGRLLGGVDKPVGRQDPGAFLREAQRGCTTITDALAGALPGPDDHSDLAFEPHGYFLSTACRRMPPGCRFGKTA